MRRRIYSCLRIRDQIERVDSFREFFREELINKFSNNEVAGRKKKLSIFEVEYTFFVLL